MVLELLNIIAPNNRHPELVSGATMPMARTANVDEWMLKHVQHDEENGENDSFRSLQPLRRQIMPQQS
jgi:hypothetical protein